jgi:MFS family permease
VGHVVFVLGTTSLLTDLSAEMVTAVLPVYLVTYLGLSPFQLGVVNGLYQAVTSPVRLVGAVVSDRWARHRDVAASGYAMSVVSKIGLLAAGSSTGMISTSIVVDRVGKGIRTAPRDAMLSMSAPAGNLGLAFGVHRAMDTFGAMLGPFAAFVILLAVSSGYDVVFVVSACIGGVGVATLLLFVDKRRAASDATRAAPPRPRDIAAVAVDRRLRPIALAGAVLALATIGDAFVYLILQQTLNLKVWMFPLLAAGTSGSYLLAAVPLGWLADRLGRARVLIAGYCSLLGVYLTLLAPLPPPARLTLCLVLLGLYYAATDGVLAALTSAALPDATRTTGLALIQIWVSLGQFGAFSAFGALWTLAGSGTALWVATIALTLALGLAGRVLLSRREQT